MASAGKIKPGSVWQDTKGISYQILGPQGADRKFPCRNLSTNRQNKKGPRAMVRLVRAAPAAQPSGTINPPASGPRHLSPAQISAGFAGGPRQAPAPEPGFDPYATEGFPEQVGAFADYEIEEAPLAPEPYEGPHPFTRPPVEPDSYYAPAPTPRRVEPAPLPRANPSQYPSTLTRHVADYLARMDPTRAASPAMVSRQVARALAEWKRSAYTAPRRTPPRSIPRGGYVPFGY